MKEIPIFYLIFALTFFSSCKNESRETAQTPTEQAVESTKAAEIILFDGSSAKGWRVFNGEGFPENWVIDDGALKCLGTAAIVENGGDLVYGAKPFDNFELTLEWKISKNGNSGIFYHVQEGEQYHAPYQTGPEYQVLDDPSFPEDHNPLHLSGADYAMYPAPFSKKTVKPATGMWNSTNIVFSEAKVQHWLNGTKLVEFVPWSEDWKMRKEASKWKSETDYGMAKTGLIGLQDHGQEVWYRNIKIREL